MARVAVLHPDLTTFGGGELVCLHVLKGLAREHEVDLVTATPSVDISDLASFGGVDTPNISIRDIGLPVRFVHQIRGERFSLAEVATFNRAVKPICSEYDAVISTINELSLPNPAVQYIHVPQFNRPSVPGEEDADTTGYNFYKNACRLIADWDRAEVAESTLLANSEWTAQVTERIYGFRPEVVYPPVDIEAFSPKPWDEREDGFVTVGRIEPRKNLLELISIVERVRERGFDTHLHIVGSHNSDEYAERVLDAASERSYVSYEGSISRQSLIDLLTTHRFGLHGREYEHFGMVVAEMVTAGMVPLVPDSGGQVEIVGGSDRVTYSSASEAVQNACNVLSGEADLSTTRASFVDPDTDLSVDRFHKMVSAALDRALY